MNSPIEARTSVHTLWGDCAAVPGSGRFIAVSFVVWVASTTNGGHPNRQRLSISAGPVRRLFVSDPQKEAQMQYLLLIHADEQSWESLSEQQRSELMQEYGALTA